MKGFRCNHKSKELTSVCPHVFNNEIEDGIKRFIGNGKKAEYICEECKKEPQYSKRYLCNVCVENLEQNCYWSIEGMPEVIKNLRPFSFTSREIKIEALSDCDILALTPLHNSKTDMVAFTSKGQLWLIDIINASKKFIIEYSNNTLARNGNISLILSNNNKLVAITSLVYRNQENPSNKGIIANLTTGDILMDLKCGDYHTEEADFPVAFIEHENETLVVHATEWNRLDITNPLTGELFTERNFENIPNKEDKSINDKTVFTEWAGQLEVSPDQKQIATIGWVWHPIGVAFSWNIEKWLAENIWESDIGESKKSYAYWDYFWHSPFFWLDNKRLCIWGYDQLHTEEDIPLNSVAIYDTESGKLLNWFAGPTIEPFYFDRFLFSGNENQDGITIWSIEEGCLLHEEKNIKANAYHQGTKEFIDCSTPGKFILHKWKEQ